MQPSPQGDRNRNHRPRGRWGIPSLQGAEDVNPGVGHTDVLIKDGVWETGAAAVQDWLNSPI